MMKKNGKFILCAAAAVWAAFTVHKMTKRKQKEAVKTGKHVPYGPYEAVMKRPLDACLSLIALIILGPLMGITALLVKLKLGSPVLFTQMRPGLNEKIFKIRKYRTMTNEKDEKGQMLSDEKRMTSFGKFLRSTSLDELPELVNILKGDMSFVGPRPLLVEYLPRYNDRQKHRHDVRPGLTGLAQASGRNSLSWEEKFEDDVRYVEKITFLDDLKIIFQTVGIVFCRKGVSGEDSVTMNAFRGDVDE